MVSNRRLVNNEGADFYPTPAWGTKALEDFKSDLSDTINTITESGYNVIRWKIEDTLLDSKHGDVLD